MTTLKRVAKEDLEEGKDYFVTDVYLPVAQYCGRYMLGSLSNYNPYSGVYSKISISLIEDRFKFYGPIELEGE